MGVLTVCLFLCWATLSVGDRIPCTQPVTYNVVAECEWTSATHPTDYPANAHFSKMCGTVHNSAYRMWQLNGFATPGVKEIAETGSCAIFSSEASSCEKQKNCLANSQFAWACTSGEENNPTVCTFSGSVKVTDTYRHVSMLSMLAPSPDWIIGVDSADLCQAGIPLPTVHPPYNRLSGMQMRKRVSSTGESRIRITMLRISMLSMLEQTAGRRLPRPMPRCWTKRKNPSNCLTLGT